MTEIQTTYADRYKNILVPACERLEAHIRSIFAASARIDRISARAKTPSSFLTKASKKCKATGLERYANPLDDIQDQIGARITVFYLADVEKTMNEVQEYFRPIEVKLHVPESEWEFGYFGRHFIFIIPEDVWLEGKQPANAPTFFELQIKTLFQHAWSEANHDLGYKGDGPAGKDVKRKLAFASAQAWGADQIFAELTGSSPAETN
jgi:putative GTP pyrophosphokinase